MRPPFPGNGSVARESDLWPDVHNSLITSIRDVLVPVRPAPLFRGCGVAHDGPDRLSISTGSIKPDVSIHATESQVPRPRDRAWRVLETTEVRDIHASSVPTGDEIEETFLTIKELPGRKLVTVIEVLSPTNKKTEGRTCGSI